MALRSQACAGGVPTRGLAEWVETLACPGCGAGLRQESALGLRCAGCGQVFPPEGGIPSLVIGAQRAWASALAVEYRQARLREGWVPVAAEDALALPERCPRRHPRLYWEVRRQSLETLLRVLKVVGAAQPSPTDGRPLAADLGAGTGWLSYRLALAGFRAVAVDASTDESFGIGAAVVYQQACPGRILAVQGDLEYPPLATATYALVVFNASLHYAGDLEGSVARAARALHPGGFLAVLDSPVEAQPRRGTGRGDRHLGRTELDEALYAAGLGARWIRVRRGPRWWWRQARVWARGHERFEFPIVFAKKGG